MAYYATWKGLSDEEITQSNIEDGYVASIIEGDNIKHIQSRGMHLWNNHKKFETIEEAEKFFKELGYNNYNTILR